MKISNVSNVSSSRSILWHTVLRIFFLLCLHTSFCTNTVWSCGKPKSIFRHALGRVAELGTIYDETTDDFRSANLFKDTFDDNDRNIVPATQESVSVINNSFVEAVKQLQIDYDTAVNIFSGLIKVNGSARFLNNLKRNSKEVIGVLLYSYHTVNQTIKTFGKYIEPFFRRDLLQHKGTHVVTEITWGTRVAVQLRKTASKDESLEELNYVLGEELKILNKALLEPSDIPLTRIQKSNFLISIFGDISLPHETLTTHADILGLLKNVSKIFQNVNNGKGTPIRYRLTPLRDIQEHLNFEPEYPTEICELNDYFFKNILTIFEEITTSELKTIESNNYLLSNGKTCLGQKIIQELEETNKQIHKSKAKFKKMVRDAYICSKDGTCKNSIHSRLQNYRIKELKAENTKFVDLIAKLDICKKFQARKANRKYFGPVNNLKNVIANNTVKDGYILFFKYQWIQANKQQWNETLAKIEIIEDSCHKFFIVDCDFDYVECKSLNRTVIKQLINERLLNINETLSDMALKESWKRSIDYGNYVANLTCGGLINVPEAGSMILRYKPIVNTNEEQRCLWTLHSRHNGALDWNENILKVSLLCDKLGNSSNTLTLHEWAGSYNYVNVSFFDLRSNTGQLLRNDSFKSRHFLYFNSKSVFPGIEFCVRVDVLHSMVYGTELNWHYDTVPGRVDYTQFQTGRRSTSIAVVPVKTRTLQFTVEHLNSKDNPDGKCYQRNSLDVYELRESGIPRMLGRFCGQITKAVSYSTEYPVFAVFSTAESIGIFKVSWK